MRQASEMLSEVGRLKQETERLGKLLRDNIRATSEEYHRLEARLLLLEQSNHPIAQVCQSKSCRPRGYVIINTEQQRVEDNVAPSKEERKRLLQGETSSGALLGKLEIPVHDPTLRLKVANCTSRNPCDPCPWARTKFKVFATVLDQIYTIVKTDLVAIRSSAQHKRHIIDDKSIRPNATLSQLSPVEPSVFSSGSSSRSMSQSPNPPNTSRHTTPIVESDSPESDAVSFKHVRSIFPARSLSKGPPTPVIKPVSPKPKSAFVATSANGIPTSYPETEPSTKVILKRAR